MAVPSRNPGKKRRRTVVIPVESASASLTPLHPVGRRSLSDLPRPARARQARTSHAARHSAEARSDANLKGSRSIAFWVCSKTMSSMFPP